MGTLSLPDRNPAERGAMTGTGLAGTGVAGTGRAGLEGLEPGALAPALPQLLISFLERRYLGALQPAQWDMHVGPDDGMRPLLREITAAPRATRNGDAE